MRTTKLSCGTIWTSMHLFAHTRCSYCPGLCHIDQAPLPIRKSLRDLAEGDTAKPTHHDIFTEFRDVFLDVRTDVLVWILDERLIE